MKPYHRKQETKPGKHGTLRRYTIHYRDAGDFGSPTFQTQVWRYNLDHVYDAFYDDDTFEIVRVSPHLR